MSLTEPAFDRPRRPALAGGVALPGQHRLSFSTLAILFLPVPDGQPLQSSGYLPLTCARTAHSLGWSPRLLCTLSSFLVNVAATSQSPQSSQSPSRCCCRRTVRVDVRNPFASDHRTGPMRSPACIELGPMRSPALRCRQVWVRRCGLGAAWRCGLWRARCVSISCRQLGPASGCGRRRGLGWASACAAPRKPKT